MMNDMYVNNMKKAKVKTNKFTLEIHPYNSYLTVIFSEDVDQTMLQISEKIGLEEDESRNGDGWFLEESDGSYIIILSHTPTPDVVAHEALHAVFAVLKRAGIRHSEENDETFTYVLGFIVRNIYKRLDKIKQNKQKKS